MARPDRLRKVRVTATLDSDVVKALDQATRRRGLSSRSRALEVALTHWLLEQWKREIEQEMEAFYRSVTPEEKRENREWTRFVARAARHRWASEVLGIPISTKVRPAPEHVLLDRGEGGLPQSSVVKCEQV